MAEQFKLSIYLGSHTKTSNTSRTVYFVYYRICRVKLRGWNTALYGKLHNIHDNQYNTFDFKLETNDEIENYY